jgi:hypothetical protein
VLPQYELRKLQSEGLNVLDVADYDSRTLIHLAAAEGKQRVLKYLLRRQRATGDTNLKAVTRNDRWGRTPLDDAKAGNHTACIKLLEIAQERAGSAVMNVSGLTHSTAYVVAQHEAATDADPFCQCTRVCDQAADVLIGALHKRKTRFLSAVVDAEQEEEEDEDEEEGGPARPHQNLRAGRTVNRVESIDFANGIRQ